MTKKTKAIAKKENSEISNLVFDKELVDNQEKLDPNDFLIPKIHMMQQMSKLVQEGVAKAGEFRNSLDGTLLGNEIDVVVLYSYKTWQEFHNTGKGGKMEYVGTKDFFENPHLPFNEEIGKITVHRDTVLGYYCMLVSELQSGTAFPYVIDFKRTSRNTGQQLTTTFIKMQQQNYPKYAAVFTLSCHKETNDHGIFYVKDIKQKRFINQDELKTIESWVRSILEMKKDGKIKVDDSDVKEDVIKTTTTNKGDVRETF